MHMTKSEIEAIENTSEVKPNFVQRTILFWDRIVNGKLPKHHVIEIMFGAQAAGRMEHGRIIGTWVKEGYRRPTTIGFHVRGHEHLPPNMTIQTLLAIYDQAAFNGIIVSHLAAYANMQSIKITAAPTANASVKQQLSNQQ